MDIIERTGFARDRYVTPSTPHSHYYTPLYKFSPSLSSLLSPSPVSTPVLYSLFSALFHLQRGIFGNLSNKISGNLPLVCYFDSLIRTAT